MTLPIYPVYVALTRPAINRLGIPHKAWMGLAGISGIAFGFTHNPIILIALLASGLLALRVLTAWDSNFFRLIQLWGQTKGRALFNPAWIWGGSMLTPLPSGIPDDPEDIASAV